MVHFDGQASPIHKGNGILQLQILRDHVEVVRQAVVATPFSTACCRFRYVTETESGRMRSTSGSGSLPVCSSQSVNRTKNYEKRDKRTLKNLLRT